MSDSQYMQLFELIKKSGGPAMEDPAIKFGVMPGWSSLKFMTLVSLCEEHFGVEFSLKDLRNVSSPEDLLSLINLYRTC